MEGSTWLPLRPKASCVESTRELGLFLFRERPKFLSRTQSSMEVAVITLREV